MTVVAKGLIVTAGAGLGLLKGHLGVFSSETFGMGHWQTVAVGATRSPVAGLASWVCFLELFSVVLQKGWRVILWLNVVGLVAPLAEGHRFFLQESRMGRVVGIVASAAAGRWVADGMVEPLSCLRDDILVALKAEPIGPVLEHLGKGNRKMNFVAGDAGRQGSFPRRLRPVG